MHRAIRTWAVAAIPLEILPFEPCTPGNTLAVRGYAPRGQDVGASEASAVLVLPPRRFRCPVGVVRLWPGCCARLRVAQSGRGGEGQWLCSAVHRAVRMWEQSLWHGGYAPCGRDVGAPVARWLCAATRRALRTWGAGQWPSGCSRLRAAHAGCDLPCSPLEDLVARYTWWPGSSGYVGRYGHRAVGQF